MEEEQRSGLWKALDVFGNLFALNVLFVLTSIPIVTIGASLTALYSMTLKMLENHESSIMKGYFRAFKENFKKATGAWLIILAMLAAIGAEYIYIGNFEGGATTFYMIFMVLECAFLVLAVPFLFPLIAKFENSLWNTFKNAFLLSLSNLGGWIKIVLIWGAPLYFSLRYSVIILSTWYLWLIIIFALLAYCSSFSVRKVFKRVDQSKDEKTQKQQKDEEMLRKHANVRNRADYNNPIEEDEESKNHQTEK